MPPFSVRCSTRAHSWRSAIASASLPVPSGEPSSTTRIRKPSGAAPASTSADAFMMASMLSASLAVQGRATELPGIGNTLQEKIVALTETGSIPAAEKLRAKFPAGLVALTRLPGLGPKRARLLYSELGVDSLDALREAAEGERLRAVKGLGPKFEQSVLHSLERAAAEPPERSGRVLLARAREIGDTIVAGLTRAPAPGDLHV